MGTDSSAEPERDGPESVRLARRTDLGQVLALWLELVEYHRRLEPTLHVPDGLRLSLERELIRAHRAADRLLLVFERASRVQGFLLAELERSGPVDTPRARIHELFIAPEARGRGFGSALVFEARRRLVAKGAGRFSVRVEASNAAALDFWRRQGFEARAHVLEQPVGPEGVC